MNNAIFPFKQPLNEPIYGYLEGSQERKLLLEEVEKQKNQQETLLYFGMEVFWCVFQSA